MPEVLGFIGLGAMGSRMARRIAQCEASLRVHDIDPVALDAVRGFAMGTSASPKELGDAVDIVFLCLPNLEAGEAVILGEAGLVHGRRAKIVVDLSTTGARFAERMASALRVVGIQYLASPVSGGLNGAVAGTLALMCSGPHETYRRVLPYLDQLSKRAFYLGEKPGGAQTMKLINNVLSSVALVSTCEAFVFGTKAGLDPDVMLEVLNSGTGRNSATLGKLPQAILPRTFDYGATIALAEKDVGLCLEEADALGVEMAIGKATHRIWQLLAEQGASAEDNTIVMKHLEQQAGVIVQGKAAPKNDKG